MQSHETVMALAFSIKLRDEVKSISKQEAHELAVQIALCGVFSNRQIELFSGGVVSQRAIGKHSKKTTRDGGSINPNSLEDIRSILFTFNDNSLDWALVKKVVSRGTSMTMLSRLTGISKTTMSRKIGPIFQKSKF
jgi:malate synthase